MKVAGADGILRRLMDTVSKGGTYLLNNLNRGLGLPDGYPFVLSTPVIEKLRFVNETVEEYHGRQPAASATGGAGRSEPCTPSTSTPTPAR